MKTSAIEFEAIQEKTLNDISASEFIAGLAAGDNLQILINLPEKKKAELEIEPGVLDDLVVGKFVNVLERFKTEKKKVELEIDPGLLGNVTDFNRVDVGSRLQDMNLRIANLESRFGR